ncbi:MAG: type IX secretion system sortase PorU [Flavobacteriales bacterium]|nr:type IX secretion system sortase PorU [Flavobacteriales bacterium]
MNTLITAAQSRVEEDVKIVWKDAFVSRNPSDLALFPDHVYPGTEFRELPTYYFRKELKGTFNQVQVQLSNFQFEPVSSHDFTSDQLEFITTDVQYTAQLSKSRNTAYDNVILLPFRKNPVTGNLERLVSVKISLTNSSGLTNGQYRTAADNSVLREGEWYKLAIDRDGVYRIDKNVLENLGVDVSNINPQQINIYGNGGELLPFDNSEFRYDDLEKNSIFVSSTSDSFSASDYILFYGKGPDSWNWVETDDEDDRDRFVHHKHYYSDSAYYYLRIDDTDAERIAEATLSSNSTTFDCDVFLERMFHERDVVNLVKSGREFFGESFGTTNTQTFNFTANNSVPDTGWAQVQMVAHSIVDPMTVDIVVESTTGFMEIGKVGTSAVSPAGILKSTGFPFIPNGDNVETILQFNPADPSDDAWLDYIALNFYRELRMEGSQMHFRAPASQGEVTTYHLANASNVFEIWDVTDFTNVRKVPFTLNGEEATFTMESAGIKEFIAFRNSNYLTPRTVGPVMNQNLHALEDVDMIIVAAPLLVNAANRLADFHREEGLVVEVVEPMQVFNEFSSGNPDVTAIKMLMKSLYDKAAGDEELMPKYLCIFGDANYAANKGVNNFTGSNVIAFYSSESLSPTGSVISDTYYGLLDDSESEFISSLDMADIGVGRIPAENTAEANAYIDKVAVYLSGNTSATGEAYCLGDETPNPYGDWRNKVVFVSDDQDGSDGPNELIHMQSSDSLADSVYINTNDYDVEKIYMDAYLQETTPGGERYPEGSEAIRRKVQDGALLVNYIGHGGEKGWAHERILTIPVIEAWTNLSTLPVFMTATCELSRYDDPGFKSAGELIMMSDQGGAIAMLTTTRIVYSNSNLALGKAFFHVALRDEEYTDLALGDIVRLTKNSSGVAGNTNSRNFSLLGDPAMRMRYPKYDVYTSELNGVPIQAEMDTVKSLEEVVVKGYVGTSDGTLLPDFNGFVYPTVFDKMSDVSVQNNDGGNEYSFDVFNKVIYRGKASVSNGEFEFRFVVPRDINYNIDQARISYYAVSGNDDAHGHFDHFKIGGSADNVELNTQGPEVNLYMNDSTFVIGGVTDENPVLFAKVYDENGINTVGNGIGHDIAAILDENTSDQIVLNDFYESDLDTYKSGEIRYQMSSLSEGSHKLSLKVWDVHNNSSTAYTEFVVAPSAELALEHVLNYPNPFTTRTEFFFEHNQACDVLEVQIQVFTVSGKIVKTINQLVQTTGYRSEGIVWDGKDDFGDKIGRGVYVYRVQVVTPEGQKAEQFEKLVILN